MCLVEKLYYFESTLVDVEVDVAFLEVRSYQSPHLCIGI